MKRRRESKPCSTKPHNSGGNTQTSVLSITDLPSAILCEIFLELPTESVVMCKSVCKTWRGIISDHEFVKTHMARGKECTLIRDIDENRISRSFFLFEDEEFRPRYCRCRAIKNKCKLCRDSKLVKRRLKIPLRNTQEMLSRLAGVNIDDAMFCVGNTDKSKHRVGLNSSIDYHYVVVNSCHGLLCLNKSRWCQDSNNQMVVCNPVTGEFMYLPNNACMQPEIMAPKFFGFGFSPELNEYKVIRVIRHQKPCFEADYFYVAEIHTIGTESWRNLDAPVFDIGSFASPVYLDGILYWILHGYGRYSDSMVSFDLNEERFQAHSIPSKSICRLALRVQGGRLHMSKSSDNGQLQVWVMNENGNPESWTELFSSNYQLQSWDCRFVCYIDNEAVVTLSRTFPRTYELFVYNDGSKGQNVLQLKFHGIRSEFEVVPYTPSFVRLKDIVGLGNVEVLSINSGCGKIKLFEETRPVTFRALKLASSI